MALNATHTGTYDVSATKAWKMIGDWSAPYITAANSPAAIKDLTGDGVGATRCVYMLDGSAQWTEKTVEYDAAGMSWTYIATSDLPVPFNVFNKDTFRCTMSVKEISADKCEIAIGCVYDLVEGTDPATVPPLEPMYGAWAAAAAAKAKAPYDAKATETYDVDAAKMWAVMKNWAAPHIVELGPATIEDLKGKGVGATRTVCFPGPDGSIAKWSEKCTAYDEKGMSWSYICTSALPFPIDIDTMVCTFSVKSVGAGKCEASIGCVYDSDAPEALPPMNEMYKSWIDKANEYANKPAAKSSSGCCVIS